MNNPILRNALVTFASFIFVITIVSAWTAPGATPPNGNVSAPITVGPTWQIRQGDLTLASTTVGGVLNSTGGIIGTTVVADTIVTTKRLQVGTTVQGCTPSIAGSLRWTGTAFEGCNGTTWGPLAVGGGGAPATCPAPSTPAELMKYLTGATANLGTNLCGLWVNGLPYLTMTSDGRVQLTNGYTYMTIIPSYTAPTSCGEGGCTGGEYCFADMVGVHNGAELLPWTNVPNKTTWCK